MFLINIRLNKCDKTVDDCLAALKFVPDWFVTSNMIKKLFTALSADENILYYTFILIRLLVSHIEFEKSKVLKKISEELMPVVWHPKRWWNF